MSTPFRRQYLQLKKDHPDAILFFRMGDFYETFDEDAEITARELNLVLTSRESGKGNKIPMAGVPHHAAESYIARLVKAGYKIAICEQIGTEVIDGLMAREVVRVVTPGTVVEPALLEAKQHNYLAGLILAPQNRAGLAYVDITTGEFAATVLQGETLHRLIAAELARISPAELVVPDQQPPLENQSYHLTSLETWQFEPSRAGQTLLDHFQVNTLDGLGLAGKTPAIQAAGAILHYLLQTQKGSLPQVTSLHYYSTDSFMILDGHTRRNLELIQTMRGQTGKGSLVEVLDATITPMGGRLLRTWIEQPLLNLNALNRRLDAVEAFLNNIPIRAELKTILKEVADLERLTSRVMQGIAHPRDLLDLHRSLEQMPTLIKTLCQTDNPHFTRIAAEINPCPDIVSLLTQSLADDPPIAITKGNVIRRGFSAELDGVLEGSKHAREWIAGLEDRERERTGIKVKVGFNKVFGYYLEITNTNLSQIPANYIRKQTLVNAERFITPELKDYETLILNAEERQLEIEIRIYREILAQIAAQHKFLYQTATALAHADVYRALAEVAAQNNYVRPQLTTDGTIDIVDGRHPVVEQAVRSHRLGVFVPNDTQLSPESLIWIITGPNMSGKSTLLRQTALIVLLAQIGSFVPARRARIGLVDRIFTRIGAQDEIHAGQSTFMVEMVETAALLAQSTPNSLLILDEIGRGTSTYDGLAIARAIIEYIHNNPNLRAKTLFATHYHELVEMEKFLPHIKNYNVAVSEERGQVVFLHKIIPGGADKSYGIHVAQLAGIPKPVISRANQILSELENSVTLQDEKKRLRQVLSGQQISFLGPETHPLVDELKSLKIEELSPLDALNKLFELQKAARDSAAGKK